jgi:hypothetical protein
MFHAEGRTDGANSYFSQFCESTEKLVEVQLQSLLGHGVMWGVGCEAFLSRRNRFTPTIQVLDKHAYSKVSDNVGIRNSIIR